MEFKELEILSELMDEADEEVLEVDAVDEVDEAKNFLNSAQPLQRSTSTASGENIDEILDGKGMA